MNTKKDLIKTITDLMQNDSLKDSLTTEAFGKFIELKEGFAEKEKEISVLKEKLETASKNYADLNVQLGMKEGSIQDLEKKVKDFESHRDALKQREDDVFLRERVIELKEKNASDIANLSQDTLRLVFGNARVNENIHRYNNVDRQCPNYDRDGNVSSYSVENTNSGEETSRTSLVEEGSLGQSGEPRKENPYGPGTPGFPY